MFTSFSIVCSCPRLSWTTTGLSVLSRSVSSSMLSLMLSWQERLWQPSRTLFVWQLTTGCPVRSCAALSSTLRLLLSSEPVWYAPVSKTGCPVLSNLTNSSWEERVSIYWERDAFLPLDTFFASVPTTGCPVLSWSGFGVGCFDGERELLHNLSIWSLSIFWTQVSLPIMFQRDLWTRPRWHENFFEKDFSSFHPEKFRKTVNWKFFVKYDNVRSSLIELQSFP